MSEGYIYVHVTKDQRVKRGNEVCGDEVAVVRTTRHTTLICCDGLGSGIQANIAAKMCTTRIRELLARGFSLRDTFSRVVRTMNQARGNSPIYTAFTLARILNNGQTTVLAYEAPPAILIGNRRASVLVPKTEIVEQAEISQATCFLRVGEGLMIFSDGVSQAGIGLGLTQGWESEGVCKFINEQFKGKLLKTKLPQLVNNRARELWQTSRGDDSSVMIGLCTKGLVLNILTGPCSSADDDTAVVEKFTSAHGIRIICGASTAKMVARCTGAVLTVNQDDRSLIAPPRYEIADFDLVCEGTVTFNQVYNIFDVQRTRDEEKSAVTDLVDYLQAADRINFTVGLALNPACEDIKFRQQGIHERKQIIEMLAKKLRAAGKLVVLEYV